MQSYELVEHIGGDLKSVYFVNGRRVSNHEYSLIVNKGYSHGGAVSCLWTRCKQLPGGKLRRTNGKTVTING